MLKKIINKIIDSQRYICRKFDLLLPAPLTTFANHVFDRDVLPQYLKTEQKILDIGGGKHPNITAEQKKNLNLNVTGLDISQDELNRAPNGIYDDTIATDITQYEGQAEYDIIICRALLEHVPDTEKSIKNIDKLTKQGGHILIFVPCKNALFSRLNMILPDGLKRKLLQFAFPAKHQRLGFKAYYDHCTPKEFEKMAEKNGLHIKEKYISYNSEYFTILAPFHILWRLYQLVIYAFKGENFCEAYVYVFAKNK